MKNNRFRGARKEAADAEISKRRSMLKLAVLGGGAAMANFFRSPLAQAAPSPKEEQAQAAVDRATRGMPAPIIKDVKVFQVGAGGTTNNVTVVKVITDQAELFGYGCATATNPGGRSELVRVAVEQYMKPLVVGRTADRIEQIWELAYLSSYYKNDTIQNCAVGGVCDALWDIKGRQAGMPVYQLVGGKVREAADVYVHANLGVKDPGKELVEDTRKYLDRGFHNVLVSMFVRDGAVNNIYGQPKFEDGSVPFDRDKETRKIISAFEVFRKELPAEVGLGCDVHSVLDAQRGTQFGKDMEQFRLFYCEDLFPPEEAGHYKVVRQLCSTPMAIGELWNNPSEWRPLVQDRLIDYIRHHVSHIGGFTAARRIAAFAENFEVKFAWHGGPNSPVGHMTNLTLGLTNPNFGIHEHFEYTQLMQDIFPGHLEIKNGYAWVNEKPGWGIDMDEALAAKHPVVGEKPAEMRTPDGSVIQGTG